ncbi:MAG: VanZ family protein [Deltaproteobacteria bacterium]|nr:VanZ family protein [Deltaproteobacteria bacterium]
MNHSSRLALHLNSWCPPLLWGLAILLFSGDLGSSHNTFTLIWWVLSWVSELSGAQLVFVHGALRKLGHMLAYGVLTFLWFRSFQLHWPERRGLCLFLAAFSSLAVALMDEGHQSLVNSRSGSLRDIGWDMAGAGVAGCFVLAFGKIPTTRKQS